MADSRPLASLLTLHTGLVENAALSALLSTPRRLTAVVIECLLSPPTLRGGAT
jgi:hypothetical protein